MRNLPGLLLQVAVGMVLGAALCLGACAQNASSSSTPDNSRPCTPMAEAAGTAACTSALAAHRVSGVLYADQFPGNDLGAKIIAALASSTATYNVVHIRGDLSPYTWSTPVTIDPRHVSIVGDGSGSSIINCTATICLNVSEAAFGIDNGGMIGGFKLQGNHSAGQIGIQSSGVQSQRWDDITFWGFDGKGAVSWNLYNSSASNGWQERIEATKIRVMNGGGLRFSYNRANNAAASFGYSNIDVTCDNATAPCVQVSSGRLYGSRLIIKGNIAPSGILVEALGDMDLNSYFIAAEPLDPNHPGTCIHVAVGGEMEGSGTVFCNQSAIKNDNPNTFSATLRIAPLDTRKSTATIGTMRDFLGSGRTGDAQIIGVHDDQNPYADVGTIHGPFIDSTFTSMQNVGINAHVFYACPFAYKDLNDCAIVGEVTNGGVGRFSYTSWFPLPSDPANQPAANCWWNGAAQRMKCADGKENQTVAWTSNLPLAGTTSSLPSAALQPGACTNLVASVPGTTSGMVVLASPASYKPLNPGLRWDAAYISSPGQVTVPVCNSTSAPVSPSSTPAFNVRVMP